jgi:tRNA-dihydrouridine synthase B
MQVGPFCLKNALILAPMAGVTDRPFRLLCRRLGAGMAVSEMVSSNALVWGSRKTRRRMDHRGESEPRAVQIAGADPGMMAEAARCSVEHGAQIIDINMGCPSKKVCRAMAGSALLRDEALVGAILDAVVEAVDVPVTLKMRTGWDPAHRNAGRIARIAEEAGVVALAIHGRTRACGFGGEAEFETAAAVKASVGIPVIANGDIRTPAEARKVLDYTGADALMIGRAAQGNPWIFREIDHHLRTGGNLAPPGTREVRDTLLAHTSQLYAFYGEHLGVRVARKHVSWYTKGRPGGSEFRQAVNRAETRDQQQGLIRDYLDGLEAAADQPMVA